MDTEKHKQVAVQFLQLVVAGQIGEAYQKYVEIGGKHHNLFFSAGFPELQKAVIDNDAEFPRKQFTTKHVLADNDLVAVHSHLTLNPGEAGYVTLHLFRFSGDKIVEMWDFSQKIPDNSPNKDGAF